MSACRVMLMCLPLVLCSMKSNMAQEPAAEKTAASAEQIAFFESRIRPVLVRHCYECHSAESDSVKGGLYVDSRDGLLTGGDSGPALDLKNVDSSLLLQALKHDGLEMPPDQRLPASVIADFESWIRAGAADPREGRVVRKVHSVDLEQGKEFWSFRPVQLPSVPDGNPAWSSNDIDRFIASRWPVSLKSATPPDAPPEVLLQRLTFVLTGLQPTVEEQTRFLERWASDPDSAMESAVDSLLSSPRYAERWGRHWLDITRFAESTGGGRSMMLPDAWRFRDYVIRSFGNDKPLPQMIREHLAGDLLPWTTDEQHDEQVIGSGYLMLGAINYEEQDKEQLRMDVVDEQIDSMGRTFLGMTLGCARCHDHKFDPIPSRDYYAMAGIFRSTKSLTPGNVCGWVSRPLRTGVNQDAVDEWNRRDKELEREIASLKSRKPGRKNGTSRVAVPDGIVVDDTEAQLEGEWVHSMFQQPFLGEGYRHSGQPRKGVRATYSTVIPREDEYVVRMVINSGESRSDRIPVMVYHADGETQLVVSQKKPPEGDGVFAELGRFRFSPAEQARVIVLASDAAPGFVIVDAVQFVPSSQMPTSAEAGIADATTPEDAEARLKMLEEERRQHAKNRPAVPVAMCVEDEATVEDWHLHVRGEIRNLGPVVPRGFLQVASSADLPSSASPKMHGSGRLELAEWVASDRNPLTARVWVNRVWQNVMGAGLVRTPDNFGTTGEPPTHPELLDFLAATFISEDHSSTRALIRRLCLSRTFRMSSQGSVDSSDPANHLWTRALRRRKDAESLRDCLLQASGQLDLSITGGSTIARITTYDNEYRHADHPKTCRSVFVPTFRNGMLDLFEVFDGANPNLVTGLRSESIRPAQALFLMNSPFVAEQAKAAAQRITAAPEFAHLTTADRIQYVCRSCIGHSCNPEEAEVILSVVGDDPQSVELWSQVIHSLFASVDFRFVD